MKWGVLFLCISMMSLNVFSQNYDGLINTMDRLVDSFSTMNAPGITIGVVLGSELIYSKGTGYANVDKKIPLGPDTEFYISSMTKEFIGAAISHLLQKGVISENEEVRRIIPELSNHSETIQVKHLLHHTSGIKDYSNLMFLGGDRIDGFIEISQIIQLLSRQKSLNFKPGEQYLYSNSNYVLLSEIISRVTGVPYYKFVDSLFLQPFGMSQTFFVTDHSKHAKMEVLGYYFDESGNKLPFPVDESPPVSCVQMVSNISDLSLWTRSFFHRNTFADSLLPAMLKKGRLNNGDEIEYASGLVVNEYKGEPMISHGGFSRGYQSYHAYFPNQDCSVFAFSNDPGKDVNLIVKKFADLILPVKPDDGEIEQNASYMIVLPKRIRKLYEGHYFQPVTRRVRIVQSREGILRYSRPESYESRLASTGEHTFSMLSGQDNIIGKVSFEFVGTDTAVLVYHFPDSEKTSRMHKFKPHDYKYKELKALEGLYYSFEIDYTYRIMVENGLSILDRSNKMVSTPKPVKKDIFVDQELGVMEFSRDEHGINGFYLSQERAKGIYFSRLIE